MPAIAFEQIATYTWSNNTTTYNMTGIPNTYTDLRIVWTIRTNSTADPAPFVRFNSDTAGNYGQQNIWSNAGDANLYSRRTTANGNYAPGAFFSQSGSNVMRAHILEIQRYLRVDEGKFGLSYNGYVNSTGTEGSQTLEGFYWANTQAISSIQFGYASANTVAYATVAVYGIKAA
jgi:hypothetical protein